MYIPEIAIVGYGGRVKKTVIPALMSLKKHIRIKTIATRKPINSKDLKTLGNIKNTDINDLNKEKYEYLYLGVPSYSVFSILNKLSKDNSFKNIRLILDTPFPISQIFYIYYLWILINYY